MEKSNVSVALAYTSRGNDVFWGMPLYILNQREIFGNLKLFVGVYLWGTPIEKLLTDCLSVQWDFLHLMDSDVFPDNGTTKALISNDLDICASPVWMYDPSTNDLHLNAIRTQGTREYRLGKGIEKVFNTSFGSVLIRRRVLDAFVMAKEKFTEPSPLISEFQGYELFPPDSVFFAKAAKLGFPVHIDWTCPFATHHKYAQFNTPFVMNFVSKVVSGYARAEGTDSP